MFLLFPLPPLPQCYYFKENGPVYRRKLFYYCHETLCNNFMKVFGKIKPILFIISFLLHFVSQKLFLLFRQHMINSFTLTFIILLSSYLCTVIMYFASKYFPYMYYNILKCNDDKSYLIYNFSSDLQCFILTHLRGSVKKKLHSQRTYPKRWGGDAMSLSAKTKKVFVEGGKYL